MTCNVEIEKTYYPTLYAGGRHSGKTTRLLRDAEKNGWAILAHNIWMERYLVMKAKELGVDVKILTVDDLNSCRGSGFRIPEKVAIDEVQLMLEKLLGVQIGGLTATTYDLHNLSNVEPKTSYFGVDIDKGEEIIPLDSLKNILLKPNNKPYSEQIHTRTELESAMDALDRLGKGYTVKKIHQQGDPINNIPSYYWLIQEET